MSDNAVLACIGFFTVVVTAVPATIAALNARQAREHAKTIQDTVGEKNGNGPAMQMLARSLAQNMELLHNQEATKQVEQRLIELSNYTHAGIHRLNGQVGMMWYDWAKQKGLDPESLPPPAPSPEQPTP